MGEIWRTIPSLPQYMASSEGRVMCIPYIKEMPCNRGYRQYGGQPHFGVWNKQDARFIVIYKGHTYKIHRLVCEAFHGVQPKGSNVCMHLDENAANNHFENLAWGTQKENLNAPGFIEYCKSRTGNKNPLVKGLRKKAEATI